MGSDKPDYTLGISILEQAIANLTANVNQLATVEIDVVAQTLSDLTAVVSATALDIRALDNTDKAHTLLPYDLTTYRKISSGAIASGSVYTHSLDESDWGEGLDFYPAIFTIIIEADAANCWDQWWHGIFVHFRELQGETIVYSYGETYNVRKYPPVLNSINGRKNFFVTIPLHHTKINSGNDLSCLVYNRTGGSWGAGEIITLIGGTSK